MIDYKHIGARIRAVRTEKKITQEQLAEAVGVGTSHISHIETGSGKASLETLIQIINAKYEIIKAKDSEIRLLRKILADNGIEV